MSNTTRILIVEDNRNDYDLAKREISRSLDACVFKRVETQYEYLDELKSFQPDIILCDYSLPSFDGMTALKLVRERSPLTPLIIWTGSISEDVAVECMMAGAANYVIKGNLKRLGPAVLRAVEGRKLVLENERSQELIVNLARFPEENPNPVMRATPDGILLYTNSASKVFLQEWNTGIGNELPANWKQVIADSFHGNTKRSMDVVIRDHFYSIMVIPLRDAGYVNLYGTDITELKSVERKYQDIFDGSPVGIFQSTPEGKFININSAMARIYGYNSPEEMIASVADIERQLYLTPEDRSTFARLLEVIDTVQEFEMENIRKDGSVIWTSTSARAVRDSNGNTLYYEGFLQDVTERRKAQAQISDLLSFNEKILTYSPLGILTYKLTGECVFANERAASIVGSTVENLRSQNFHTLESWKSSGLYRLVERAISTKTLTSADIHQITSFEKDTWLAVRCVTFQAREEEHLLLSVIDITERKLAEEELHQKNDDLRLLNVVNNAVVRGQDLDSVIDLLTSELKRIFAAVGSTVYMLSADKRSVSMHQYAFSPEIQHKIERLIGFNIPKVEFEIKEGGHFHNAMLTKQSAITSDPDKIQDWIMEFTETKFLPPPVKTTVRKLVPHIYKLLKIRSTIIVPLISHEEVIGFLDVSAAALFTPSDLKRVEAIGEQLTSLILRQQANEKVRKSEEFLQGIQNSLSTHLAILDENGVLMQVNEAWREFGDQNGLRSTDYGIGMNYLAVCDVANGDDAKVARETAIAIRQVLSGVRNEATIEYPCHSPTEHRWFVVHITCFDDGKHKWIILAHENITERKQAESAQLQSQARYQDLFDKSPVSLWEEDYSPVKQRLDALREDGVKDFGAYFDNHPDAIFELASLVRVIDVNKTTLDLYCTGNKADLLKDLGTLMGTDLHQHFREEVLGLMSPARSFAWDGSDKTFDGQDLDVIVKGTIPAGYEEDWSRVIVSIVDITDRKQVERELRKEQEKAQNYLDIAGVMMIALDQNGNVSMINQTGCQILGYAHDEIIGKNWIQEFLPESVRGEMQGAFQTLMFEDAAALAYYESPVLTKSGEQRMIAWHNTLMRNEDGKVITSLSSGEDITERKRAENELRASEERFRQLAANIEEVFWMTEVETGKELYASPALEKIWGISFDTLLNEPDFYLKSVLPDDRWIVLRGIEMEKNGEKVEMEYRITRPDGSIRWIWDRAFPISDEDGKVKILAGVSTDITERKQNELEIQRHLAELEALYENGLAIGRLLEPKEIGNQIIQTFTRHLSWHHVAIRLLNPETERLELIAFNQPGLSEELRAEMEMRFATMVSKVGQGLRRRSR